MRKRLSIIIAVLCFTGFFSNVTAKSPDDPSLLTLERIFEAEEFEPEDFEDVRWLEHKPGYTQLEPSTTYKDRENIVYYDPKSGKRQLEVDAAQLIPPGQKVPMEIESYEWSPNGAYLMVFTNTQKVWRRETRGDYWVLNMATKELWQLGGDAESAYLMFAEISPGSSRAAYVYKNNIYVQYLAEKPDERKILQLTHDGSKTIINGTFDWVYEEELGLRKGFRWNPDGKHIAYWQLDSEGISLFHLINNTDSLYPRLIPIPYPKPGTVNSAGRVGVVSAGGGETRWFQLQGDPRQHYIARMEWAFTSKEVLIQYLNRKQNTNTVMLGNIADGTVRTLLVEKEKAWLSPIDDVHWLKGGKFFTWLSERSGWKHIYLVSRDGKTVRPVTRGEFDVIECLSVDGKRGWVYYTASPHNPTQRYLYRSRLSGKGKPQRLSPAGSPGTHEYAISEDSQWAVHTYSRFGTPKVTSMVRLPSHKRLRVLEGNEKLMKKVALLERQPVEFFRVDIGNGVQLDGYCMKPTTFDPAQKYPVLFYVYGEPAGQTVLDNWGRTTYFWHLMLTQQGYMVMSVDNRGTPSPRGRAWRKSIYRKIGILNSSDQAAAVRQIIKDRPYIDPERIGVWGWSGGGTMTLNAMFRYPDLYSTGMSVAPVPDQRLYDSIYQERYMSLPEDNPEGYKDGSPITYAHQLKGNLLIVHGTGDDNVHYQGTERVINKLIEHNKPFSMMAYPNRSHAIDEGDNTTLHLYNLLTRYLKQNLPASH